MIENSTYNDEFLKEYSQLLVEASISTSNQFVITFTKINESYLPKSNISNQNITYIVSSTAYFFEDIDFLLKFVYQVFAQNLFIGNNSLYNFAGKYLLVFSPKTVKCPQFVKTFSILSEYCSYYISKNDSVILSSFKERANQIFTNNAIQKLMTIF